MGLMNLPSLPEGILQAGGGLFEELPLGVAMGELVPTRSSPKGLCDRVARLVQEEPFSRPELSAGLWLYVDELERSHRISQNLPNSTGAFWHAIMHRREGDFGNSHYWFRRVGEHPALRRLPGYDPHGFVDAVARRYRENPPELVDWQRREWVALFCWCWEQVCGEGRMGDTPEGG
jgi:hypothetical protein